LFQLVQGMAHPEQAREDPAQIEQQLTRLRHAVLQYFAAAQQRNGVKNYIFVYTHHTSGGSFQLQKMLGCIYGVGDMRVGFVITHVTCIYCPKSDFAYHFGHKGENSPAIHNFRTTKYRVIQQEKHMPSRICTRFKGRCQGYIAWHQDNLTQRRKVPTEKTQKILLTDLTQIVFV